MRGQIFAGKIGAETGKAAGQNAAYDKHRRIGKHTESSGKQTARKTVSVVIFLSFRRVFFRDIKLL